MKRYVVVVEKIPESNRIDQSRSSIREAIELHIEGMQARGLPIPEPTTQVMFAEVAWKTGG